jgi:23S rRNA (guanine2069-N7)-methyltransferase / 23S rRNA (guanine2445-N2)-methyltransferase
MSSMHQYKVFVSCPKGLQYALEAEVKTLGLERVKPVMAGVEGFAGLSAVYRILLWSRVANRVFLEFASGKVDKADDVYDLAQSVKWNEHFNVGSNFSVSFAGTNSVINNSTFGALTIKDAIVDQFRLELNERPNVSKDNPDIRVAAKLSRGVLSLGLDVSGESLHKRGYRLDKGPAPLKENLAGALLQLSKWAERSKHSPYFVDPMCGSGTFCIEAAMICLDLAPNLHRTKWGFDAWLEHDSRLWGALVSEAEERFEKGSSAFRGKIVGYDQDAKVVSIAWQNIERAGLKEFIHVEKRSLGQFQIPEGMKEGLLLTNPPYGERLGEVRELESLYRDLGRMFEQHLVNWECGVFTGNADLGRKLGWRSHKQYKLLNGAIESQLILITCAEENRFKTEWMSPEELLARPERWVIAKPERAQMLRNRLQKNQKTIGKWAAKQGITCFRIYDADMPEYSFAIDVYQSIEGETYLHVQEYAAPKTVDQKSSLERLAEGLVTLSETLGVAPESIFLKRRQVQKGSAQYERDGARKLEFDVVEHNARFEVNLGEYLDTGLFLDHRVIRHWMQQNSKGKSVLNLYAYTGAVSVHAALGGASLVNSVDMSQTYLKWAQRNFELNGLKGSNYQFTRANCMEWLEQQAQQQDPLEKYDVIFIDPPSFSNSKRMEGVFDVQRDHVELINKAAALLASDGLIIFSNNLRKFKLDDQLGESFDIKDKTSFSLDKDFERNSKIHRCWFLKKHSR